MPSPLLEKVLATCMHIKVQAGIGAGYRVYFGRQGQTVVILLCGGSKKSQPSDIKTAKDYWADWKLRQK